jgi:hypothetical protein
LHLTSLDSPELGPGTIVGPSEPSGSASTGPTNAYSSTPASSSSPYSTSSDSRGSSSSSATPIPIGGHRSNTGAIAGGVAGGSGNFDCHCRAALLSATATSTGSVRPPASAGQPSGFNPLMDQVPRPMLGQGTIASSLPETTTSLLRPYVCVFAAPAPLICAHVFFLSPITLRTRMTQLRTPHTKELRRLRRIILFYRLPRRPAEAYTPLPPRRTPKDRDSDITAFPLSELTV